MSEPRSEDDGVLREWAPLSGLLGEVPLTVRRGLFLENVALTCVDAIQEYIAVGTNIGVVYWYHRESHNIQRLRPEVLYLYLFVLLIYIYHSVILRHFRNIFVIVSKCELYAYSV